MTHAYQDTTESVVESHKRIHDNGEETHVHILSCGERYLVLAGDVDPREFGAVAGEAIGYEPTKESAHERATAWMEQHPKGIADGGSSGSRIVGALKKLNDYGDSLAEQQQNTEQQ